MRKGLIYSLSVFCLLIFFQEASGQQACDHEYQAAIRFIVHAPSDHPFTVNAEGDQVLFSHGNLQYCPARDEWRFALRQFDRCGNGKQAVMPEGNEQFATPEYGITTVFWDSAEYTVTCNNLLASKKYGGWIDLFAWGTSGHGRRAHDLYATYFFPYDLNDQTVEPTYNTYGYGPSFDCERDPGALSNDIDTLSGSNRYFDWGFKNPIREYFGCKYSAKGAFLGAQDSTMYRPGVWRTPTHAEWDYLLTDRKVAGQAGFSLVRLQYGENPTDTVTGVIIYPDDFLWTDVDVGAIEMGAGHFTEINATMWSTLEQAGCVFLPGASERVFSSGVPYIDERQFGAYSKYWTANAHDASDASSVAFLFKDRNYSVAGTHTHRNSGLPVRLVQDYQPQPTPQRTVTPPPAPKQGLFSISETQKVNISRGNLQYQASTKKWRFAQRQFDRCGIGGDESTVYWNDNGTQRKCDNSQISETYGGWIDIFGWGTSGVGDANPPYFTETKIAQYPYSWSDWGQNTIGTYAPNKWRTMTIDEWKYLIERRKVDGDAGYSFVRLKFGSNPTDTVTGVIIYPDDFTWSDVDISAIGVGKEKFTEIDATIWNALEQVGCVFLPGSGYRSKNKILAFYTNGFYWSATAEDKDNAYLMRFFNDDHNINYISYFTYFGLAVRLVRDVNPPKPTPTPEPEPEPEPAPPKKEGLFSISETKKVNIAPGNLQYCAEQKKWRFAKRHFDRCGGVTASEQKDGTYKFYNCPANVFWDSLGHRVPCNNLYVSENYGGWIDLFGWGTSGVDGANPPYFTQHDADNYSWSEWGQNQIGEYAPNTWRTPTWDDWKYLLQTRKVDGGEGYSYVRIRYGNNATDTVSGLLIYPDNFRFSAVGVTIPVGVTWEATEIDADTWSALYDSGCAFLPACCGRTHLSDSPFSGLIIDGGYGRLAYYWSSTPYPYNNAVVYSMNSNHGIISKSLSIGYREYGFSVRLVRDVE